MAHRLPKSGPQVRRSPTMVVAGIVLVIAGSLVSVGIYSQLSQTQEVIAVVSPVARGEQIQRTDLITVRVGFDALLKPIPASQLNEIVGQYAAWDIVPGTFLTADAVGARISPSQGQAHIGIALMAGEYPDDGLLPGDQVLLVAIPEPSESITNPISYPGTLVSIVGTQSTTMITTTVQVSAADAPILAVLAASDRLALVLASRER